MSWAKAKDLFTGEMIARIENDESEDWFFHHYWKIVGHKHEEHKVLLESSSSDRTREIDYDTNVMTRPFGYKSIRPECLSEPEWKCYREWPYNDKGVFCDPPNDYSGWGKDKSE